MSRKHPHKQTSQTREGHADQVSPPDRYTGNGVNVVVFDLELVCISKKKCCFLFYFFVLCLFVCFDPKLVLYVCIHSKKRLPQTR